MNEINIIQPYWYLGMWVFDDQRVGLLAEPFVGGADTMIDRVTADIPEARQGFIMVFSGRPFPNHQYRLEWRRPEGSGNVYYSVELDAEGWLCPALLRYFEERPPELYVQVKPLPSPSASQGGSPKNNPPDTLTPNPRPDARHDGRA